MRPASTRCTSGFALLLLRVLQARRRACRRAVCAAWSAEQAGLHADLVRAADVAAAGSGRAASAVLRAAEGSAGRWFVNLQYTHELENTLLIAPGLPVLDLLDGDALSGGGQPRHSVSARAGFFYKGFGLISFANYTGSSRLEGSGVGNSTNLEFGDLATVNLRAFVDLGQQASLIQSVPLLDKTRIGIGIDNVFDARQTVTDDTGTVPLRYQPFLIDPIGRSIEIEFRKLF